MNKSRQSWLRAFIGAGAIVAFFVTMFIIVFILDSIPGFLRTTWSSVGLTYAQAKLLFRLNAARANILLQPEASDDDDFEAWDTFNLRASACWEANIAPWRIKLAGGEQALACQPYGHSPSTS